MKRTDSTSTGKRTEKTNDKKERSEKMKREKTMMYRVVREDENEHKTARITREQTILFSTRSENEANEKFMETVSECVKRNVLSRYEPKEIEFGTLTDDCSYVFPKELAETAANRVIVELLRRNQKYFHAKDACTGDRYSVFVEKMVCVEEV